MGEFYNMSEQSHPSSAGGSTKSSGCYISTLMGFIFTFLVLILALGVGIVVHFAGNGNTVVCDCQFPGAGGETGAIGGGQHTTMSPSDVLANCVDMAAEGNNDICEYIGDVNVCNCMPYTCMHILARNMQKPVAYVYSYAHTHSRTHAHPCDGPRSFRYKTPVLMLT
jgi:hypothetical protein